MARPPPIPPLFPSPPSSRPPAVPSPVEGRPAGVGTSGSVGPLRAADAADEDRRQGRAVDLSVLRRPCRRSSSADRKSTRLNSSHDQISYAVFCLKKKKNLVALLPSCHVKSLSCSLALTSQTAPSFRIRASRVRTVNRLATLFWLDAYDRWHRELQ